MDPKLVKKLKPYVLVLLVQVGAAGFAIVAKAALNQGSSHFTFAVYRNAIAAVTFLPFAFVLERKIRPRMTLPIFMKIVLLSLLDPVFGQNIFYAGMKYSTATVTAALCNVIPALTFVMAWIFRIEKMNMKDFRTHAKIIGTLVTLGGAMIMTLITGATLGLPWTHKSDAATSTESSKDHRDSVIGAIMIMAGCTGYSGFFILQSMILKTCYPAGLSLTAIVCTLGALIGTVLTFTVERGNTTVWALGWDAKLLGYTYGGIVSSGITYYLCGIIMKYKGPVFATAFNPLSMIFVAIMSSFIFAEQMTVGKLCGAMVIVVGLYLVIWGKSKDEKEVQSSQNQQKNVAPNSSTKGDDSDRILGHNVV